MLIHDSVLVDVTTYVSIPQFLTVSDFIVTETARKTIRNETRLPTYFSYATTVLSTDVGVHVASTHRWAFSKGTKFGDLANRAARAPFICFIITDTNLHEGMAAQSTLAVDVLITRTFSNGKE